MVRGSRFDNSYCIVSNYGWSHTNMHLIHLVVGVEMIKRKLNTGCSHNSVKDTIECIPLSDNHHC